MNIVECSNLSVGYNGRAVNSSINFSLAKGDFLCIFGKNGSGKSTLVKTLLGIIPPVSGKLEYGISKPKIGYLCQQKEMQKDFPCGVREAIMSGFQNDSLFFYTKEQKKKMAEICSTLEISDLLKKSFSSLSGGQQQKVLLARALCASQELLVLDEPMTGLDPSSRENLCRILHDLNENGLTVIMISHNLSEAEKLATKTLDLTQKTDEGETD